MVIGSFVSVPAEPPLVGFLQKESNTWQKMKDVKFCVSLLSDEQEDA